MKVFFISCLMLLSMTIFAQEKANNISINKVDTLMTVAYPQEVVKQFGTPQSMTITPSMSFVRYQNKRQNCLFIFNSNKKLASFYFTQNNHIDPLPLSLSAVKKGQKLKGKKALRDLLGVPRQAHIVNGLETWQYQFKDKDSVVKPLKIIFANTTPPKVLSYSYTFREKGKDIGGKASSASIALLKIGEMPTDTVIKRIGGPAKLFFNNKKQRWLYHTGNNIMMIYFDTAGKVSDYILEKDFK